MSFVDNLGVLEKNLRHRYPDKPVSIAAISACDPQLRISVGLNGDQYWRKVENTITGRVRCGWVSMTAGWQPCLMLMPRKNSNGSWDLLSSHDRVIAWKNTDGRYR